MKKLSLILCILIFVSLSFKAIPNPIVLYSANVFMNEITFNEQGEWMMELQIWFPENTPCSDTAIKTIRIYSASGSADLIHFTVTSPLS